MKRKSVVLMLIVSLVLTLGVWNLSYADDLQDQMDAVEQEKAAASEEMSALTEKVEAAQKDVDEIQAVIDVKQVEIEQAIADIEQTKNDINNRQEGLNDRLRTMYKNGSVGYLDVLLGSNNISEFLNNVEMIQRIYQNDQDTLVELEEQHQLLENKQAVLETEKAELDVEKDKIVVKKEELVANQAALQEKIDALNAEADAISAEIEKRQRELEEQQQHQQENSGYDGGALMWPCDSKIITSEFGYRVHPLTGIYTGHTGIDIGCAMYAPIYAAEDGTVIMSQWYGGYGYAVVIDHGNGMSTLYGHNEELYVSVGQKVNRGDVIAGAGSTGWSTGPHLHFEVRIYGEYVDPMGYF